jgi:hypothetical protein
MGLGPDGQTYEVASKHDFDVRIRNATVIGKWIEPGTTADSYGQPVTAAGKSPILAGTSDASDQHVWAMPPQLLILVLESGSLLVLFMQTFTDGTSAIQTVEHSWLPNLQYTGRLLAVDPASNYLVLASSDSIFVVCELEPWEAMNAQYVETGQFHPIKSSRIQRLNGFITQIAFLYPRPEDTEHVMLLLTTVQPERRRRKKVGRVNVFDWELGADLSEVLARNPFNLPLPDTYSLPALLIPLTIHSAFIVACSKGFGIFKNLQEGFSYPELIAYPVANASPFHYGVGEDPLWVSWSRPFRSKTYFKTNDVVYLAREDGVIVHLSIDHDGPSLINVGHVNANIDTAFTVGYGLNSDLLVVAGTTGAGGIWKVSCVSGL